MPINRIGIIAESIAIVTLTAQIKILLSVLRAVGNNTTGYHYESIGCVNVDGSKSRFATATKEREIIIDSNWANLGLVVSTVSVLGT